MDAGAFLPVIYKKNKNTLNMSLTVVQQHLFNYFKTVHVSARKDTHEFYRHLSDFESFCDNLSEEISGINRVLKQYDIEIVECTDELTCEKSYVLVNTVCDEISQKARFYDKNVTNFFSEIVKDCVISENGYITETHCLNLSSIVSISKTAAQNAVEVLVKDKWLISKDGSITLGTRTIAELEQSIRQLYPDKIKLCPLCKLFILQGFICDNCNARYHFVCLRKLKAAKKSMTCCECKENFHNLPSQVTAIQENENDLNPKEMPTKHSTPVPAKKNKLI